MKKPIAITKKNPPSFALTNFRAARIKKYIQHKPVNMNNTFFIIVPFYNQQYKFVYYYTWYILKC